MRTLKIIATLTLAVALTGCGTFGLGGKDSRLGDGRLDLLPLIGIIASASDGDFAMICEAALAADPRASATEVALIQAACRGLLGQLAPQSSSPAVPPFGAPPSVVAGSAVPAGDACESLEVAFQLAADACGWQ